MTWTALPITSAGRFSPLGGRPPPWPPKRQFYMEKFVERQNIARFTTLLMTETDTAKRELLQKLLTDEMVRQASHSDARNKS